MAVTRACARRNTVDSCSAIAARLGIPQEQVQLGGDHLGPNCWQDLPAEDAMARSEQLIADYIAAGFRKMHLDCSMSCAGDPIALSDATVAARTVRLCAVAEQMWRRVGGEAPYMSIDTESGPGGAQESLTELALTGATAASATIDAHWSAFQSAGLHHVWPRVIGLVVQAGVEFDHHKVIDFQAPRAIDLVGVIEAQPYMVYEAHSTDYQTPPICARWCEALRNTKGRSGADLRHARGALGVGPDRARVAWHGAVVAVARNRSRGHDGDTAILEQILSVRRPAAGTRSAVQPERSNPLLLADARGRGGAESPARAWTRTRLRSPC